MRRCPVCGHEITDAQYRDLFGDEDYERDACSPSGAVSLRQPASLSEAFARAAGRR